MGGALAALVMLVMLASSLVSCGLGSEGWRLVRNDAGELYEVAHLDQGIELGIGCGGTRLHYSGSVPLTDGGMEFDSSLPVHMGYWQCTGYSCNMRNGTLDELIATVDRHQFTYILVNDTEIAVDYDFRAVRPMLEEVRQACRARSSR